MHALQETVNDSVKCSKPRPDQKRWWSHDLSKLRKKLNRLRAKSYRYRALTSHFSHREFRKLSNEYDETVIKAKQQHWTDYLEDMSAGDIWTANRYLREPVGDGGVPRIPTIRVQGPDRMERKISDNKEKVELFAKIFFPPPPAVSTVPMNFNYPIPLPDPPEITEEQIQHQIQRLSPFKVPEPDSVPNVVLQKSASLIVPHLLHIYRAILKLGTHGGNSPPLSYANLVNQGMM